MIHRGQIKPINLKMRKAKGKQKAQSALNPLPHILLIPVMIPVMCAIGPNSSRI